jgi:hypothetical protein
MVRSIMVKRTILPSSERFMDRAKRFQVSLSLFCLFFRSLIIVLLRSCSCANTPIYYSKMADGRKQCPGVGSERVVDCCDMTC